ncbi:MAG: damage-control phosphatase ARMT1 family protein [Anaerolineae bacterium]
MKTYLDCFPCFLRQVLDSARVASLSEAQQHELLRRVLIEARDYDTSYTPSEMSSRIQEMVRQASCNGDPYRHAKDESTQQALTLLPRLRELVRQASDPLETAVRLSIAGNIIDHGVVRAFDLESTIERVLVEPFAINHLPALRAALARCRNVLYLADNAGETVFDRLLIEQIPVPVTYVVKAAPTVNDATREDAIAAGIHEVATVVDNGSDALGTLLYRCSSEFIEQFWAADLIIAKGQANFESIDGSGAPAFYLLQAKCEVLAKHLGVPQYGMVVKQEPPQSDMTEKELQNESARARP